MTDVMEVPGNLPGPFPWDEWEEAAKARGIERTLAELGRSVIREAENHAWSRSLQELCDEETLLDLLTRAPFLGRRLCELLLETDGLRVAFSEESKSRGDIIQLPGFGGQY